MATNVAHCTQMHDMWPFGPLVIVYASIYSAVHPANIVDMLKYLNDVRLAASRSGDLGFSFY